ncbi:hypothetical protein LAZ67_2000787 [Cordylochernes scorpioides]|uniref:Uncharacterized protein n=1 Tax=Cordylochernes scorpioides TaxID=51811 RepID=A0ABY6K113_9ARAC|nr:hypothetical protein LAZ67_2000787 [Cordylochernes scorpioides]
MDFIMGTNLALEGWNMLCVPGSNNEKQPHYQTHLDHKESCQVRSNLYEYTASLSTIYHYDVTIKSNYSHNDICSNKKRPLSLTLKRQLFISAIKGWDIFCDKCAVFDGNKNCYTTSLLPIIGPFAEIRCKFQDEAEVYRINIQPTKKYNGTCMIDTNALQDSSIQMPQEVLTTMSIVLRHHPSLHSIPVSQGFFNRPRSPFTLEDGLEIWPGYTFSLSVGRRLFLNFEICMKLFYPACNIMQAKKMDILRKAKIFTTHRGFVKKYKIIGFGSSAAQQTFEMQGTKTTVLEYFRSRYPHIQLKHPDIPVIDVGIKNFPVYIPQEICYFCPNQTYDHELSLAQQMSFVPQGSLSPNEKFTEISKKLSLFLDCNKSVMEHFKISINPEPVMLKASLLKAPVLKYKNYIEIPKGGIWQSHVFYKPIILRRWLVLAFNKTSHPIKDQIKALGDKCHLSTTIVTEKNIVIKDTNKLFCLNLIQNINSKLRGINWILDPSTCPRMLKGPGVLVMGADVFHAAAKSPDPSIAAVSCNIDEHFNNYEGVRRQQPARCEIIQDLKEMVAECLSTFYRNNPSPNRIFFFRDGVGEGQFDTVKEQEIPKVLQAFTQVFPTSKLPTLTYIVVIKRHHLRISEDILAQNGQNVLPGTALINTVATKPNEFLLCSHPGIIGTSIPIKYVVLHDDCKLSNMEICQVAYALCHLHSGSNRTISIPIPVHHAHHQALRGKESLANFDFSKQNK